MKSTSVYITILPALLFAVASMASCLSLIDDSASVRYGVQSIDTAKTGSAIPPKRAHHALVYDELHKQILMTAGSTAFDGGKSYGFYNDLWVCNDKGWTQLDTTGDKRSGVRLAFDTKRKQIFSFGGYAGSGDSSLCDLRVLQSSKWKTLSYLPKMKAAEPGFVYDEKRDRLIVFGGSAGMGLVNAATWEWDGKKWAECAVPGPEGRQAFVMIYDAKRKKTVLFGGMGTSPKRLYNDTWEFDGRSWQKVDTAGPGPLASPGFCYDAKRGELIVFGGLKKNGVSGETWSWNGVNWKKVSTTGPSARVMGYMAYDKQRERVVLFGGRIKWPDDANDTWEWDGKNWKQLD